MSRQARCGDLLERDGDKYVCDRIDAHKGPHSAERWVHNDDRRRRNPRRFWLKLQWVDLPAADSVAKKVS